MALNKVERELLVAARELIESGDDRPVSFVLAQVVERQAVPYSDIEYHDAAFRIKEHAAIWECNTFALWAGPKRQRRLIRLAWINWMLDQPGVE
jgi:hypothetical protein